MAHYQLWRKDYPDLDATSNYFVVRFDVATWTSVRQVKTPSAFMAMTIHKNRIAPASLVHAKQSLTSNLATITIVQPAVNATINAFL